MDAQTRVAVLGCGRMGGALVKGLIKSGSLNPSQIVVSDKDQQRTRILSEKLGVTAADSNGEAVRGVDTVLIAVKPGDMRKVAAEIGGSLKEDATVISIAAGVKTSSVEAALGRKVPVVRVMPNSTAQVRASISVISAGRYAGPQDMARARDVFSAVGVTVEAPEEEQDIATALSGSGPAYFYLFVEALSEAGVEAGLARERAFALAHETMFGASRMLKMTGRTPEELIEMVASPGGTTAAALEVFEEKGLKSIVKEAVRAALRRAGELEP